LYGREINFQKYKAKKILIKLIINSDINLL